MRLTEPEIHAIVEAAREVFGPGVVVRLFGSRVDDSKRGGDIDLHVTLPPPPAQLPGQAPDPLARVRALTAYQVALWRRLGERKIDVVAQDAGAGDRPIDAVAKEQGVILP